MTDHLSSTWLHIFACSCAWECYSFVPFAKLPGCFLSIGDRCRSFYVSLPAPSTLPLFYQLLDIQPSHLVIQEFNKFHILATMFYNYSTLFCILILRIAAYTLAISYDYGTEAGRRNLSVGTMFEKLNCIPKAEYKRRTWKIGRFD